jgi:hypothetical protein
MKSPMPLSIPEIHYAALFETGKSYREYFTEEEIQAVSRMFSKFALQRTWDQTNNYSIQ